MKTLFATLNVIKLWITFAALTLVLCAGKGCVSPSKVITAGLAFTSRSPCSFQPLAH